MDATVSNLATIMELWVNKLEELTAGLFVVALVLLIIALLLFLKEVQLATRVLQMGKESLQQD